MQMSFIRLCVGTNHTNQLGLRSELQEPAHQVCGPAKRCLICRAIVQGSCCGFSYVRMIPACAQGATGSLSPFEHAAPQFLRMVSPPVQLDVGSTARSRPSWLPDGSLLAAPGLDKDILLFERLSWKQVGELKGGHSGDVRLLAYSKNGEPTPVVNRAEETQGCVCACS